MLAYAAPVLISLTIFGMAISTKRRLDKRKARMAKGSENSELHQKARVAEDTSELVFVTEVEPGIFKRQPAKELNFSAVLMHIDADTIRGHMTNVPAVQRAIRAFRKITTP